MGKEATKELDKYAVAVLCTSSHCKEGMVGHVQQKSLWLHYVSILASLRFERFLNWEKHQPYKWVRLEISANFHLDGPEEVIKVTKKLRMKQK